MHGGLAQVVALVSHGNAWLHDLIDAAAPLNREHLTFTYVRSVTFGRRHQPRSTARSVTGWFRALRRDGGRRLWVLTEDPGSSPRPSGVPAHQLVAFANPGGWAIGVEMPGRDELWTATWKMARGGVWEIVYRGVPLSVRIASLGPSIDVTGATARLRTTLERIVAFAAQHDVQPWARLFGEALRGGDEGFVAELLPPVGYAPETRRLMSVAAAAWVFGGMGSWNDLVFSGPDGDRYEELTSTLYAAVLEGIITATNAFDPTVR